MYSSIGQVPATALHVVVDVQCDEIVVLAGSVFVTLLHELCHEVGCLDGGSRDPANAIKVHQSTPNSNPEVFFGWLIT